MKKKAKELFSDSVIEEMRNKIESNQNNEVFFIGFVDEETGKVSDVEAIVYGNQHMTPVFLEKAVSADVVIHNHPSGNITPSDQDLQMADVLMNHAGVSFLIIDNLVMNIKVVYYAPSIQKKEKKKLSEKEIFDLFEPGGKIASTMPDFEKRISQEEMIKKIIIAYNENKAALIEAGTGTGKSMAYLIPSIYWAIQNKEKVVISTFTKHLQHQLFEKDLPALKKALGLSFDFAIVKGKNNYICRKRFEENYKGLKTLEETGLFSFEDVERLKTFDQAAQWILKTKDGDLEELPYEIVKIIGDDIRASSDLCLHRKCGFFNTCFVNQAKQKVFTSDLIITNHHFLLAQFSLDFEGIPSRILPKFSRIVVDEAHNFKKAALSYLEDESSYFGVLKTINRLYNPGKKGKTGEINLLINALKNTDSQDSLRIKNFLKEEVIPFLLPLKDNLATFLRPIFQNIAGKINPKEVNYRLKEKAFLAFQSFKDDYMDLLDRVNIISSLSERLLKLIKNLTTEIKEQNAMLIKGIERNTQKLKEQIEVFQYLFQEIPDNIAVWVNLNRHNENIGLHKANLEVNDFFKETLFKDEYSVVFTSATLAIQGSFKQFKEEIGLDGEKETVEKILTSPFDYSNQVRVMVPSDVPIPKGADFKDSPFIQKSLELIGKIINASQGGVFVLCTSFEQIRLLQEYLRRNSCPYPLLIHGEENRSHLMEKFKLSQNSVLLGTDSFWEGVDIRGDALRTVIIFKLPFRPPTDPVTETLYEMAEKRGEHPFMKIAIPEAVIKFKQGFGRLIRSKQDRGVVIVLDKRIIEQRYGSIFIESLPIKKKELIVTESDGIVFETERFLGK